MQIESIEIKNYRLFRDVKITKVPRKPNRKRYLVPDRLSQPSKDVKKLAPSFQKIAGARAMATQLNVADNTSESFKQFISGLSRYIAVRK